MKKYLSDLTITHCEWLNNRNFLLKLTQEQPLPEMRPGQFVQIKVANSPHTFLRRPISIHFVNKAHNELWLMIQVAGEGTRTLSKLQIGDTLNLMFPLGNGFSETKSGQKVLLVGGGVGIAPLLYLGSKLQKNDTEIYFLLGGRTASDLLELDTFSQYGKICTTTEDGSAGQKGFVTQHSIWNEQQFDFIYTCGPTPMMKAVALLAKKTQTPCEVSLENTMACGIGACLCCVTPTTDGHKCVCTDGPVFNIQELEW